MECLDYGLDDFVVENFFTQECMRCRVFKLLNYNSNRILHIHSFNSIYLDSRQKVLYVKGISMVLTPLETIFFQFLIDNNGYCDIQIFKAYLEVCTDRELSRNCISMLVSRLRKKIRNISGYNVIRNRYKQGYYLDI